jgi:hypothetical protein
MTRGQRGAEVALRKLEKRHRELLEGVIAYIALSKHEWTTPWKQHLYDLVDRMAKAGKSRGPKDRS